MNQQEWTIMVYMAGDNNLSVDMAYAMEQIKEVSGKDTDKVNLFVYYDGSSASIPTLYCDFSSYSEPKHVRSFMVGDKLFPVEGKQNENAADHRSVLNFVDWCVNKVEYQKDGQTHYGRRANRYGLIFSGHSLGFQDIGMFKDESAEHTMTMEHMNNLLERITKSKETLIGEAGEIREDDELYRSATTEILGQKLDILGFDSCVMGMLEVGSQFASVAKTMIASEGSVPNAGWTYAKIFGNLTAHGPDSPITEIAKDFVSEFVKSQDSYTIGGISVDMAAWDLNQLPKLNGEFEELAEALIECFSVKGSTIYRQMERALLQVHWKCQSYMLEQNVDLGDFCELLKDECGSLMKEVGGESIPILERIEKSCEKVLAALTDVVLLSGFCGGKYQYSNGISLFFPWSLAGYEVSRENYESLHFVRGTGAGKSWNRFLESYLRDITYRRALTPTETGAEPPSINLETNIAGNNGGSSKVRYYSYEYNDVPAADRVASVASGSAGAAMKIGGQQGSKMGGQEGSKMGGQQGSKMGGQEGSKMGGQEGSKMGGQEGSKMGGQQGSKMGGQEGSKMGGQEGSKMGGQEGSKMGGQEGSKMGGQEGSKMGGQEGSKMGGQEGSKMGGQQGSKMGGQEGSKMGGQEGSKMGGQEGSKMGGQEGSKMGGQEGSKMGGQQGSKIGGGGGSGAFFDSFKHFKNIETPWNLSGFTKTPNETSKQKEMKKTTS